MTDLNGGMTAQRFAQLAVASGLVSEQSLRELWPIHGRGSAQALADALVHNGLITDWHRDKLLAGKHRGFILGKYKLLRLLDSGGMAQVFLAEHQSMQRQVAIKVLSPKRSASSDALQRFQAEAKAFAALDHPHIVKAFDFAQEGAIHYLVMEYVEGPNLQRLVEIEGPLTPPEAADIVRQAALALDHAHQAGIIHRDVKPANIMWEQRKMVRLLDLGLVRALDTEAEYDSKRAVLGTTDYVAPEQAVDCRSADARADIYSLGCTLYFLLTGQPPFNEGTIAQRLLMHQGSEPRPLTELRPDVSAELAGYCSTMLSKDPQQRPPSASAVAKSLSAWLKRQAGANSDNGAGLERGQQVGRSHSSRSSVGRSVPAGDGPKGGALGPAAESPLEFPASGGSSISSDDTVVESFPANALPRTSAAASRELAASNPSPSERPSNALTEAASGASEAVAPVEQASGEPGIDFRPARRSISQELRARRRAHATNTPAWVWLLAVTFLVSTIVLTLRLMEYF